MGDYRLGVVGCGGRMGRMLLAEIARTQGATLAGGTARALAGQDLGLLAGLAATGLVAESDAESLFAASDAIIDFTLPAATVAHAALAAKTGRGLVIGTTGLDAAATRAIEAAARHAAIVWSPNMSLGVNLLMGLVEQAAARLGPDYDIEILEMHHRLKVDAPSGTALGLGAAAAAGRAVALQDVSVRSRDGHTGPRTQGTIGFASLRGGDVVGDHVAIFAGPGERIELAHKAADRAIYARGAVRAALWTKDRPPGLYGMKDVLGLR